MERDTRVKDYIMPRRVIKTFGEVKNTKCLLKNSERQISTFEKKCASLSGKNAGILFDFGQEYCGGAYVSVFLVSGKENAKLRLSFGESANEAIAGVGEKGACNDHSARDFTVTVSNLYSGEYGQTGYRFLFLELLDDCCVQIKAVQGTSLYQPYENFGSFYSSDKLLDKIYSVALRTVFLCVQDNIWDGIKRDRLVWIGDLCPEMKALKYTYGDIPEICRALDFAANEKQKWVNDMPTYTLWWLIVCDEWCRYTGNKQFVEKKRDFILLSIKRVLENIDGNGVFTAGDFFDWPTRETKGTFSGVEALTKCGLEAAVRLLTLLDEQELVCSCENVLEKISKKKLDCYGFKQTAAFLILEDMADKNCKKVLESGGAKGFSTFMSYYILSALALCGGEKKALKALKDYYGGMLKAGATSFWEDFDIEWLENSCKLDEICPENKSDIHGDNGKFCYTGFRHSLCHGWSAGVVPFLIEYVLGINVEENGKIRVSPHIDTLDFAGGSIYTPYGKFEVKHEKDENGRVRTTYSAPREIEVVIGN